MKSGNFIHLLVTVIGVYGGGVMAQLQTPEPYPSGIPLNHIRTCEVLYPEQDESGLSLSQTPHVKITTQYMDGLGRPLQTVLTKGSLNSSTGDIADMVSPIIYDDLGRETSKYLSFPAYGTRDNLQLSADGSFKFDAFKQQFYFYSNNDRRLNPIANQGETFYYSQTYLESSPLNRPLKTLPPGNSWVGSDIGIVNKYFIYDASEEDVKIWNVNGIGDFEVVGTYPDASLSKTVTSDEQGHLVVEYKDKAGLVILKKVQAGDGLSEFGYGYDGWLSTYYIYDNQSRLRVVLSPKAVKEIILAGWTVSETVAKNLCFYYEYDFRNRMTLKQVPGAAPVAMIYDKWDRLVLTQDGNLKLDGQWLFTKYDELNRPIYTGVYDNNSTREEIQNQLNASNLSRYESYAANGTEFQYTLTNSFPQLNAGNYKLLTATYYDNYDFATGLNGAFSQFVSPPSWSIDQPTAVYPFIQSIVSSDLTKGLVTGRICYALGTLAADERKFYASSIFYDDKGRPIQTVSHNAVGSVDIITNQYTFAGLINKTVVQHNKNVADYTGSYYFVTKFKYDDLNRVTNIYKQSFEVFDGHFIKGNKKEIVRNEYDALGQLTSKGLGAYSYKEEQRVLETLKYDYNIRGWLLGMNRAYLLGNDKAYFGMELAYDNGKSVDPTVLYSKQFNGNIAGTMWKSAGDGIQRKYDFTYDNVNRLMTANFVQKDNGTDWRNGTVDFSIKMGDGVDYNSAYDENGNIKRMQQWGLRVTGSAKIDDLNYTYEEDGLSNRLKNVFDLGVATAGLGDFNTSQNHAQIGLKSDLNNASIVTDYKYDENGNMSGDENKDIESIKYNCFNLPSSIELKDQKGTILFTYDGAGNKISKCVIDKKTPNTTITTTTSYVGGVIYEAKKFEYSIPPSSPGKNYKNKMLYLFHEEGRMRYNPVTKEELEKGMEPSFVYDFFVKDHLGNVRMVLTDEGKEDKYPAASLEEEYIAHERNFYSIPDDASRVNRNNVPGYPQNDLTTEPNLYTQKLSGNGTKVGSSIVLKVMSGDKVNIKVSSWYKQPAGVTPEPPVSPLNDLLGALTGGVVTAAAGGGHVLDPQELTNSGVLNSGVTNFLNDNSISNNLRNERPKAYLNWILLDEQFQYVASSSGAEQVPDASVYGDPGNSHVYTHIRTDIPLDKNGYLYIYVSNETPNIDVFFDNLQVTHYRGVIFDETHYYPFGLTMQGISSKAMNFGGPENKRKFNGGSELQNKEFSDGSGLEMYDTHFRQLDPQLGRWWQIDPKPNESESPYSSMGNNPILFNDILGDTLDFPGASEAFINQAFDAISYLNDHGVGDNMLALMESPIHFSIYEQGDENGDAMSASGAPVIIWSPTNGLLVDNGVVLSPATNLDHEADHQLQRVRNPAQYDKDRKTPDKDYDNKEERRVITGREQKVALALGEIKKGQVTRKNHLGLNVTTPGPTSNKYNKPTKKQEQEIIDRIKKQLEEMHKKKNEHPGSAGPADKNPGKKKDDKEN